MPLTNPTEIVVFSASVVASHAQILTGPTTPIVILPATETLNYSGLPTAFPLPLAFMVSVNTLAGAYGGADPDAGLVIGIGSDWSIDGLQSPLSLVAPIHTAVRSVGAANSLRKDVVSNGIVPLLMQNNGVMDNALVLAISNSGNLTGGHADNSLKVSVLYTIIEV